MSPRRRRRAEAWLGDERIAVSDDVVVVEGIAYFPRASVRDEVLRPSYLRTLCWWKGVASYFHVEAGGQRRSRSAWTYRHPSPLARVVKDRVAFWWDVDVRLAGADGGTAGEDGPGAGLNLR